MAAADLDADFHALLDVEALDRDLFRSRRHEIQLNPVLFGGEVMAQALMSACRTVEAVRPCHSLHAYFLRPGDGRQPVIYDVERTRDGASFTTRRVIARQKGEPIFHLECSFHRHEEAMLEHQTPLEAGLPAPEDLLNLDDIARTWTDPVGMAFAAHLRSFRNIEVRPVEGARWIDARESSGRRCWVRLRPRVGDDPLVRLCGLAYLSDYWLAGGAIVGRSYAEVLTRNRIASLDHAMWFHRPAQPDDWLLYDMDSPSAQGGRGLIRGQLFARDGALVASAAQEALFRPYARPKPAGLEP